MSTEQEPEESNLQPIPEEWQDISLKEITEADYEVVPQIEEKSDKDNQPKRRSGRITPPGRVPNDDSIDASSEDPRGTDQGYIFTGYDTEAATRIGDETDTESARVRRFRRLNEGRHRSDGAHSIRESQRDKGRIIEAICSSLPLAPHEREKVRHVVEELEFERFGYQKGLVPVILGTVIVVVDERHRDVEDMDDTISWSDEFRQTCDAHDITMSDLGTVKEEVRYQMIIYDIRIPHGRKLPKRDPSLPDSTSLNERPKVYWDIYPSTYWGALAQYWERAADDLKNAIPEEYRKRIEQIRRWEPWNDEEEEKEVEEDDISDIQSGDEDYIENIGEIEDLLEGLEDELEQLSVS